MKFALCRDDFIAKAMSHGFCFCFPVVCVQNLFTKVFDSSYLNIITA